MTPTYREIADAVTARITAGEWQPGERLPTTEEFAAQYEVSEATSYRALSLLIDRGTIRGEQGRARFIPGGETGQ
jgi:GntR family transcriptional regulator